MKHENFWTNLKLPGGPGKYFCNCIEGMTHPFPMELEIFLKDYLLCERCNAVYITDNNFLHRIGTRISNNEFEAWSWKERFD